MIWVLIILVALVVVIGVILIANYNGLVSLRNKIEASYSQIDVQLERRYSLIPNLVEIVKGYAAHEASTLEAVVQARNAAVSASGPADQAQAETAVAGALKSVFALSEAYPELKANTNFQQLQADLASTEDRIAYARQYYNDNVRAYNTKIQAFPSNIIANSFKFTEREYFQADGDARGGVSVTF